MSPEINATPRVIAAAVLPPVVTTAMIYFSVMVLGDYGWILFLALPMVLGFSSVVIYAPHGDRSFARCFLVSLSSLVTVGVFLTLFAIEGLICLLMTLPIAVPMMALGAFIANGVTRQWMNRKSATGLSAILFLMIPVMMGFEASDRSEPTLHSVVTTVEIDAPIETVWRNVIAFPAIDAEPDGVLSLGFAYPTDARIEGDGVGAIRYCNFSTGPFVEPITIWQEPNLLAFDVSEQPAPMVELTPYSELHAAHLQYIRSQKGQFRLYEANGKTFVEGTTFYTHDIAPDVYWNIYSERIIRNIHRRVLDHIKTVSEVP